MGDKARAGWEEKGSIGRGSAIDDCFDEWKAKPFQISPSPPVASCPPKLSGMCDDMPNSYHEGRVQIHLLSAISCIKRNMPNSVFNNNEIFELY